METLATLLPGKFCPVIFGLSLCNEKQQPVVTIHRQWHDSGCREKNNDQSEQDPCHCRFDDCSGWCSTFSSQLWLALSVVGILISYRSRIGSVHTLPSFNPYHTRPRQPHHGHEAKHCAWRVSLVTPTTSDASDLVRPTTVDTSAPCKPWWRKKFLGLISNPQSKQKRGLKTRRTVWHAGYSYCRPLVQNYFLFEFLKKRNSKKLYK